MHRVRYKATLYLRSLTDDYSLSQQNFPSSDEQRIVFIEHDHLHRYVPGTSVVQGAATPLQPLSPTPGLSITPESNDALAATIAALQSPKAQEVTATANVRAP